MAMRLLQSDNLVADRLDSAGYSLAQQLDDDGGTELVTAGTTNNVGQLDKDNIYSKFVNITKMSKAEIPRTKRYALVTPDYYMRCFWNHQNLQTHPT